MEIPTKALVVKPSTHAFCAHRGSTTTCGFLVVFRLVNRSRSRASSLVPTARPPPQLPKPVYKIDPVYCHLCSESDTFRRAAATSRLTSMLSLFANLAKGESNPGHGSRDEKTSTDAVSEGTCRRLPLRTPMLHPPNFLTSMQAA